MLTFTVQVVLHSADLGRCEEARYGLLQVVYGTEGRLHKVRERVEVVLVVIAGDGGGLRRVGVGWLGLTDGPSVELGYVTLQCLLPDERPGAILTDDGLGGLSSPRLQVQLYGVILPGVALECLQGHPSALQFVSLGVSEPAVLGVADNFPTLLPGVFVEPAALAGTELRVHRYGDVLDDPVLGRARREDD